jgi:hypothetical protein
MIGQVNIILKDRHKVRGVFLTPEQQEQERLKKEEIIEKRNERRALNKAEREGPSLLSLSLLSPTLPSLLSLLSPTLLSLPSLKKWNQEYRYVDNIRYINQCK